MAQLFKSEGKAVLTIGARGFRIAIFKNKSEKYMSVIVTCHNLHVCVLYN